jgi:hypothetical protein
MRLRFSLRTFFLFTTLVAIFCYVWFIRPTQLAERFARAVNSENYAAADQLFLQPDDWFLSEWAHNRWSFRASCDLYTLTLGQLLTARRQIALNLRFFEFDHRASQHVRLAATPFGLTSPSRFPVQYSERLIDSAHPVVDESKPREHDVKTSPATPVK